MRSRKLGAAVLMLGTGIGLTSWLGAASATPGRGVFGGLRVGEPVTLLDMGTVYEVRLSGEKLPTGEEIAEVGDNYLVIKSQAGIETRIPVTSVKAVVRQTIR